MTAKEDDAAKEGRTAVEIEGASLPASWPVTPPTAKGVSKVKVLGAGRDLPKAWLPHVACAGLQEVRREMKDCWPDLPEGGDGSFTPEAQAAQEPDASACLDCRWA